MLNTRCLVGVALLKKPLLRWIESLPEHRRHVKITPPNMASQMIPSPTAHPTMQQTEADKAYKGIGEEYKGRKSKRSFIDRQVEGLKSLSQSVKDKGILQTAQDLYHGKTRSEIQEKQAAETFRQGIAILRKEKLWTFAAYREYQQTMMNLATGNDPARMKQMEKMPGMIRMKETLQVLNSLNVVELASNHKDVFTPIAKRQIAEKANVMLRTVERVIEEHDALRADRRWYTIREMLGLRLPRTAEERQLWAETDRPFSETEQAKLDKRREESEKKMLDPKNRKKKVTCRYYRHKTSGIDRWRNGPPDWIYKRWKSTPIKPHQRYNANI